MSRSAPCKARPRAHVALHGAQHAGAVWAGVAALQLFEQLTALSNASALSSHPGGVWFCDLTAAHSVDGIAHAVALALDLPLGGADPIQQLGTTLAFRGDCLLILDNFEQVARYASAALERWLGKDPFARFLVTGREVLGLVVEQVRVLAPMGIEEAQTLLCLRMDAVGLQERLDIDEAAIAELVVPDRLPLAIELAAARARTVSPADQVRRTGGRFRLLVGAAVGTTGRPRFGQRWIGHGNRPKE
jgi:predicted ATPase